METKKTVINALVESEPFSFDNDGKRKRTVAAYCRVSTDEDEQLNSYANQVNEWTERIAQFPNYSLYKVYGDEGVTGTDTKQRTGFQQMISDAERGKFDLIMCKSISRFGRNTVITLSTIRHLKEIGVEVYFDNEHISTFDPKNEFMFTIMSSMAQEESRHISENVRWTFKRLMEKGNAFGPGPYGYKLGMGDNGIRQLKIDPEKAPVIKMIYDWYDSGFGVAEIARRLEDRGILTYTKKGKWNESTITEILKNDVYKGTLTLQKTYTVDYIGHKRTDNRGQKKTYVFQHAHEPIVSEEQWQRVNDAIKSHFYKASGGNINNIVKYASRCPLSGLLLRDKCGRVYKRRHWSGHGYITPRIVYQCNGYVNNIGEKRCESDSICENIVYLAVADMFNNLYAKRNKELSYLKEAFIEKYKLRPINHELEEATILLENAKKRLKEANIARMVSDNQSDSLIIEEEKLLDNCQKLERKVKALKAKKSMTEIKNNAFTPILNLMKGRRVSLEDMKTFPIKAVIEWIKVIDKTNILIVIDVSRKFSKLDIKNRVIKMDKKGFIFQNTVKMNNPTRPVKLNYFVKTI